MFIKKGTINIDEFHTYQYGVKEGLKRIMMMPDGTTLLIGNENDKITINIYKGGSLHHTYKVDSAHGQLVGIVQHENALWLEFHNMVSSYETDYIVVKVTEVSQDIAFIFQRESYMHNLEWHKLFVKGGELYLHLVRHNRLHHYLVNTDPFEAPTEIEVMENGEWYICGTYILCLIGETLELYDSHLNLCNTIEYDFEIDEMFYTYSVINNFLAICLTDLSQQETTILMYHVDTQAIYSASTEEIISDMGTAAGRVWFNPCGMNMSKDLGGLMVYDRFAWPLYVHMRTKDNINLSFGAYPPPFHRSYGIFPMQDGNAAVVEKNSVKIFDFNCHGAQEIYITHPECVAFSHDGASLAVLNLDLNKYNQQETVIHRDAVLDFYEWNSVPEGGGKVIEILRFQK